MSLPAYQSPKSRIGSKDDTDFSITEFGIFNLTSVLLQNNSVIREFVFVDM